MVARVIDRLFAVLAQPAPARAPKPDAGELPNPASARFIDQIVSINPTASGRFLEQFDPGSLARYLDHLRSTQEPRGRQARWVRPADSPAIVMAERE